MFPQKTLLVCSVRESVPRYSQVRGKKKTKKTKQNKNKQTNKQKNKKNRQAKMTVVERSEKQSLYDVELDICSTKMHAQTSLFNCTDKFLTLTDTKKARLPCTLIQKIKNTMHEILAKANVSFRKPIKAKTTACILMLRAQISDVNN